MKALLILALPFVSTSVRGDLISRRRSRASTSRGAKDRSAPTLRTYASVSSLLTLTAPPRRSRTSSSRHSMSSSDRKRRGDGAGHERDGPRHQHGISVVGARLRS